MYLFTCLTVGCHVCGPIFGRRFSFLLRRSCWALVAWTLCSCRAATFFHTLAAWIMSSRRRAATIRILSSRRRAATIWILSWRVAFSGWRISNSRIRSLLTSSNVNLDWTMSGFTWSLDWRWDFGFGFDSGFTSGFTSGWPCSLDWRILPFGFTCGRLTCGRLTCGRPWSLDWRRCVFAFGFDSGFTSGFTSGWPCRLDWRILPFGFTCGRLTCGRPSSLDWRRCVLAFEVFTFRWFTSGRLQLLCCLQNWPGKLCIFGIQSVTLLL